MEIKKCEGKENQFILNNKKVTINKEISEKFYDLIKTKKYNVAFDLINDEIQVDDDFLYKPLKKFLVGSIVTVTLLLLASFTNVNLFFTLSMLTLGVSVSLAAKEAAESIIKAMTNFKTLKIMAKELDAIESEKLENKNAKNKEQQVKQTNSFVFDKKRIYVTNIIDFNDYKNTKENYKGDHDEKNDNYRRRK